MSAEKLLFKLTRNSLLHQYQHAHDAEIGKYITADELEDILDLINEHTKLGIAAPRWTVSTLLFPIAIIFTIYSGVTASVNGYNTIYIGVAAAIISFASLFGLTFIAKQGIYPEFIGHVNDINLKYAGKVNVKLDKTYAGFSVVNTVSSDKLKYDYTIYLYGMAKQETESTAPSSAPSSVGDPAALLQRGSTSISYANSFVSSSNPAPEEAPNFGQPTQSFAQPAQTFAQPAQSFIPPTIIVPPVQSVVQPAQSYSPPDNFVPPVLLQPQNNQYLHPRQSYAASHGSQSSFGN
ncbi:hypothetical protein HK103_006840 [Boothiomyces macroporosus]|uniref:Uncharacterized protein n=1 Tax=Boothiomyces macroporosus TaxID=261099 RepID=A0AAD5UH63_9FUNG|nr:hypothetical protein HK103_006840 [Boothiomyces macroporosus]